MSYLKDIEQHGQDVTDFEVSPFESLDMLHLRSHLNKESHNMTLKERILQIKYDLELLENMDHMVHHIKSIYNLKKTTESQEEWWWTSIKLLLENWKWRLGQEQVIKHYNKDTHGVSFFLI